ncbi:MAG: DnaA/Hda family protein [Deltaproteobacteria bacterium]|nr:DnaA/Hda family protein [Deltaproteobacteria bacterium]
MTCPPQVERAASVPTRTTALWTAVLARLRAETPSQAAALEAWLEPLAACEAGGGLRLACPSAFHLERVRERYLARIERHAREAAGAPIAVALVVGEQTRAEAPVTALPAPAPPVVIGPRVVPLRARPETPPLGLPPHDFASFAVGPGNALAREACAALARGRQLTLSPLYLVGGRGTGKTHLACATAHAAQGRGERVLYVSAEQFTNELMAAIRAQRTEELKRRYREGCDLLVFEDVSFLRGKRQTQLELLHTLEHLLRRGARALFSAEQLPLDIPELEPRLASLLASGLCAEIEAPDPALRREILRARAAAAGARLPDACVERLADAVRGSVRDLEAALVQVLASASLLRRPIDLALVEAALRKVTPRPPGGALEPERVAELVAAHFGLTATALASRSRRQDVLLPRQVAMFLCTRHTDASLERIGRAFGRSHPAVANAAHAVRRALAARPALQERLAAITAELEAQTGAGGRKGPRRAPR